MATKVITYERGSTYITNVSEGKLCHALVGELWIGGLCFDTLERYDDDVTIHLPSKDFLHAVMYWHPNKHRVIHPWAGKASNQKQENILVHAGTKPSHFRGCIGVGFLEKAGDSQALSYDKVSLELIWEHAGGVSGNKEGWNASSPIVSFQVLNAFPAINTLKPHMG